MQAPFFSPYPYPKNSCNGQNLCLLQKLFIKKVYFKTLASSTIFRDKKRIKIQKKTDKLFATLLPYITLSSLCLVLSKSRQFGSFYPTVEGSEGKTSLICRLFHLDITLFPLLGSYIKGLRYFYSRASKLHTIGFRCLYPFHLTLFYFPVFILSHVGKYLQYQVWYQCSCQILPNSGILWVRIWYNQVLTFLFLNLKRHITYPSETDSNRNKEKSSIS